MLAVLAALLLQGALAKFDSWSLVLLDDAVDQGAVCLDGSPAGYFFEKGWGSGANQWTVHFQGGGWCTSLQNCLARSKTTLGSSKNFSAEKEKTLSYSDGGVGGYLSNKQQVNPDMYNWNKVLALYCDGGSRAGNVAGPVPVGNETVYFRGAQILNATLRSLAAAGLRRAENLIVGGCSAGGLTVWLHLDYIRAQFPAVRVVGLPQCGFFMDLPDFAGRAHYTPIYKWVFERMNMRNSPSLRRSCFAQYPDEPWRCFMAQYVLPFVETPVFVVNSFYDSWQMGQILQVPDACMYAGNCTAQQKTAQHQLRDSLVGNLSAIRSPSSYFLYSCVSHCQFLNLDAGWTRLTVGNVTLREAFARWRAGQTSFLTQDPREPNKDPTCWPVTLRSRHPERLRGGSSHAEGKRVKPSKPNVFA